MMYFMVFKWNVKGFVFVLYWRLEDGSEVFVEYWGMVVDYGYIEEDGGVEIIIGSKVDYEVVDVRVV